MIREPILLYGTKNAKNLNYLHLLLLFIAGITIATISLCIGKGAFTASEISYALFTLRSDIFEDSSLVNSFVLVLRQSLIDLIPICLAALISITVISRPLLSALLIIKGFICVRHIGAIIYICNRSEKHVMLNHPTIALFLSLATAVIMNALLIYLCNHAKLYNENIILRKDSSSISVLLTSDTSKFVITFLTVLGTVIIISIFKSILLYLTSLL